MPAARRIQTAKLIVVLTSLAALYVIPSLAQMLLLRFIPGWIFNVVFADLIGCVALALMGRVRHALLIYMLMTVFEAVSIVTGVISITRLVWIMNLLPAAAVAMHLQSELGPTD